MILIWSSLSSQSMYNLRVKFSTKLFFFFFFFFFSNVRYIVHVYQSMLISLTTPMLVSMITLDSL